jgi:outer membrane lipoprotein-sorting protein
MKGATRALAASAWLALCLPFLLPAPTSLFEQVRAKIAASQPFRTDFVQQVFIDGEMSLEESGFIIFVDRNHVKWQYLQPDYKTFILENGHYRFFDRENNQLLTGNIGPGNEQIVWDLLCAPRPGQAGRWDERTRTIRLKLEGNSGPQELKIRIGADLLPARVEQTAASEVSHVYLFTNYRAGITVGPGEFALDLPGDVEIIEQE